MRHLATPDLRPAPCENGARPARRSPAFALAAALSAALSALASLAPPAFAGEGLLEINQACATQTGCFSGDAPGFPVTITAPGSYLLTGNVSLTDANATGIEIATNFVTIDLGGFSLAGPISCTGFGFNQGLVCAPGTGDGIFASTNSGITVRNGTIRGFADYGFYMNGSEAQIDDMMFHENGRSAAVVGDGARIRNSLLERNGGNTTAPALVVSTGAVVENLVVRQNQNVGASIGSWSIIRGNSFSSNGGNGLTAGNSVTVVQNNAAGNGGDGISVSKNSLVSENASGLNGGDGIQSTTDTNVQRNTVAENDGYGLRFSGANVAYRENQISNNTTGTVSGGFNMGSNTCNGSGICP